jgi:hypothetical protein
MFILKTNYYKEQKNFFNFRTSNNSNTHKKHKTKWIIKWDSNVLFSFWKMKKMEK